MTKWILWLTIVSFLIASSFVSTMPFIITALLLAYIFYRDSSWVLILAFLMGFFLDASFGGHIGKLSMFLLAFIFVVSLYERKFEVDTYPFIFFATLTGSFSLLELLGYTNYILIESVANAVLAVSVFFVLNILDGKR